jgi:hypothetical protein
MARLFRAGIFTILITCFFYSGRASAVGGTCPSGADYLNPSGNMVTLASLGVTNCYYISAAGSDSNSGTSESSPWAHLPGMTTCTGTCASVASSGSTALAGTGFILRGGDTWGSALLGISWDWGGTTANPVYIGVDLSWFSGASWTRPVFNCGGTSCGASALYINRSNVIEDNIEWTGLSLSGSNTPYYISFQASNVTVSRNYMHGWSHDGTATKEAGGVNGNASGGGAGTSGSVVEYNVCDGTDTSQDMFACYVNTIPNAWGNVAHLVVTAFDGPGDNWHDNMVDTLVNCYVAGGCHQDGIYNTCAAYSSSILLYNNVVRHTTFPGSGGAVKFWLAGNCPFSGTGYMFNNVVYDNLPGNLINTGGHNAVPYGTWYIFNNTVECGTDSSPGTCILGDNGNTGGSMTLTLSNNHWISTSPSQFSCTKTYVCTESNAVAQTLAQAQAQGYTSTSPYAFQPTSAKGSTVTAAASRQSLCSAIGEVDAIAGGACQEDTSYACAYDSTNHAVSCPMRTAVARAAEPNIGAYQFSSTQASTPNPPVGLTVSIQ